MNLETPSVQPKKSPVQEVLEKTEQSIRILSELWDKRFGVLEQYYKERNKKRFVPFKSEDSIQSEIKELLPQLSAINIREEKVIEILGRGIITGKETLQNFTLPVENISENEAISGFNGNINSVSKII